MSVTYCSLVSDVWSRSCTSQGPHALNVAGPPRFLQRFMGGLDARHRTTTVRHLAEVLWESLAPEA